MLLLLVLLFCSAAALLLLLLVLSIDSPISSNLDKNEDDNDLKLLKGLEEEGTSYPSGAFLLLLSNAFALINRRALVTFPSIAPKGYRDSRIGSRSCLHAIACV